MKKMQLLTAVVLGYGLIINGLAAQGLEKARIKIDIERKTGEIDKNIYGNFAEHLGRCIYGGIYDPGSPNADQYGFRKDVAAATMDLNVPILRWPGGNFVSGYHWEDGIGPVDQRPVRIDLAWGAKENNRVGTDEFLRYCKRLNIEPYICVNMGLGTPDEARNWVEYCNIDKGTYYSDLRRKNGSDLPYKVKYWGLGNEIDGPWQMGHKNADDYGKVALEAAKLMKWIDPEIKLIASGSSNYGGDWIGWNRTVLNYLREYADYISLHLYVGNRNNDYYRFMASTMELERNLDIVENQIREVLAQTRRETPIYIAFDEYNVWYRKFTEEGLEEIYNLEDALVVAQFLNSFVRNAHIVKMANMAQLVNVIAPMMIHNDTLFYQSIFYPLQLFASYCYGQSLEVWVDSDHFSAGNHKMVPYLDVSAAYQASTGNLVISVVNRHKDHGISTDIISQYGKFSGPARVHTVNGKDIKDFNTTSEQKVRTVNSEIKVSGTQFNYNFPAHSYTMIIVKVD